MIEPELVDQEVKESDMELITVRIEKSDAINFVLGQTHSTALILVGTDHRLAAPEPLERMFGGV